MSDNDDDEKDPRDPYGARARFRYLKARSDRAMRDMTETVQVAVRSSHPLLSEDTLKSLADAANGKFKGTVQIEGQSYLRFEFKRARLRAFEEGFEDCPEGTIEIMPLVGNDCE